MRDIEPVLVSLNEGSIYLNGYTVGKGECISPDTALQIFGELFEMMKEPKQQRKNWEKINGSVLYLCSSRQSYHGLRIEYNLFNRKLDSWNKKIHFEYEGFQFTDTSNYNDILDKLLITNTEIESKVSDKGKWISVINEYGNIEFTFFADGLISTIEYRW